MHILTFQLRLLELIYIKFFQNAINCKPHDTAAELAMPEREQGLQFERCGDVQVWTISYALGGTRNHIRRTRNTLRLPIPPTPPDVVFLADFMWFSSIYGGC